LIKAGSIHFVIKSHMNKIEYIILISITFLAILSIFLELMHAFIIKAWRRLPETESKYWLWGIFYFNPDDKRILVPKRIKWLGWTLNMSNPVSIMFIAGIFLLITLEIIFGHFH
jgi:uncharacterized membrane protein